MSKNWATSMPSQTGLLSGSPRVFIWSPVFLSQPLTLRFKLPKFQTIPSPEHLWKHPSIQPCLHHTLQMQVPSNLKDLRSEPVTLPLLLIQCLLTQVVKACLLCPSTLGWCSRLQFLACSFSPLSSGRLPRTPAVGKLGPSFPTTFPIQAWEARATPALSQHNPWPTK